MKSLTGGHLKAGIDSLRGSKWRNVWTMLGVIIGVASVLIIVGIGEGIKQQISSQLQHVSKNLISIVPGSFTPTSGFLNATTGIATQNTITGSLSPQEVTAIAGSNGVGASAPLSAIPSSVSGAYGTYKQGLVLGTTPDLASLLNQSLEYGSFLTNDDMNSNTAVLGVTAAERLFKEDVPLGSSFMIDGQSFIVRGVFNSFDSAPLSGQTNFDNDIFIPSTIAAALAKQSVVTYEMLAYPAAGVSAESAIQSIRSSLENVDGGATSARVQRESQNLSNDNSVLELLTRLIGGAAAISLIVGGIGIMNVMLVSVTERMHEIGIRKAIGATNRQILSQFMIEATVLSVSGGVIGIIIAFLVELGLRVATSLRPTIGWQITLVAFFVSLIIGIVFGSFPAWRAARKQPIEALRTD